MDGITVLAISLVTENEFWIMILGFVLIFLCGFLISIFKNEKGKERITTACIIIFSLFTGIWVSYYGLDKTFVNPVKYNTYKITVSSDVKFTDFMKKYEILSQEGQIYTVKEKEKK